jgi:hypothetical protein
LLYRLGRRLPVGVLAAAAGAWVMAAFPTFARCALNGPQKKTVMVLFVAAALMAYHERRWFIAGAAGILAGLCLLGAFVLPVALALGAGAAGIRPLVRMCAGAVAAGVAVASYYMVTGSLGAMVDGAFGMLPFHPLNSSDAPALFARSVKRLPAWQSAVYLIGGLGLITSAGAVLCRVRPVAHAMRDTRVVAALGLAMSLVICLRDFQGSPDFFVLLPFLGLGWMLVMERATRVAPRLAVLLTVAIACAATLRAANNRSHELDSQRQLARAVLERFGDDASVRVIGAPEWLVLTRRTQDDPFVFIVGGIDRYIDARRPGGFTGWLDQLKRESPDVIVTGDTSGPLVHQLFDWLESAYDPHPLGKWTACARKPEAAFPIVAP